MIISSFFEAVPFQFALKFIEPFCVHTLRNIVLILSPNLIFGCILLFTMRLLYFYVVAKYFDVILLIPVK